MAAAGNPQASAAKAARSERASSTLGGNPDGPRASRPSGRVDPWGGTGAVTLPRFQFSKRYPSPGTFTIFFPSSGPSLLLKEETWTLTVWESTGAEAPYPQTVW